MRRGAPPHSQLPPDPQEGAPDRRHTRPGSQADTAGFAAALDDARAATAPAHEELFVALPASQRAVLRAVCQFGSPWAADAARFLDLAKGTVTGAVRTLTGQAVIERTAHGDWRTVDPLLGDWVERTLPR